MKHIFKLFTLFIALLLFLVSGMTGMMGCAKKVTPDTVSDSCSIIVSGIQNSSYSGLPLFRWWLYSDGVLRINGTSMPPYNTPMMSNGGGNAGYEYAPWYNEEYRNSITSVIIEEGISNIGKYTFYQCNNIVSIIIPGSITDISSGATFTGCRKITKIINHRAIPQTIDSSVFEDIDKSNCTLIVPAGSENVYGAAEGWKDFVDIKPIQ